LYQDIAGFYFLAAVSFYAASLGIAVATVSGTTGCFFMSHG
jgi:hypothetical protein